MDPRALDVFLAAHGTVVLVRVADVRGSAPREAGAQMLVAAAAVLGTIGGGRLEYEAIARARSLSARGERAAEMEIPLGPEIGQCCGGRVTLALAAIGPAEAAVLKSQAGAERAARPSALIFGAGHVGRALAAALALLPVRPVLVDSREGELAHAPEGVERRLTAIPEAELRAAPPGSAFVILTHDHALDFLLAAEALRRGDAAYVGMIGSRSKRAAFAAWCRREDGPSLERLVCPIGAVSTCDKRPEVIAAFVAAEIISVLTASTAMRPRKTNDADAC